ncbi:MAG: TIGR01906 family membrane protein [Anaerolineaceae bacterium]|nr:TIGR01906 family membrane protein [Anaerolineaceae bacterium]
MTHSTQPQRGGIRLISQWAITLIYPFLLTLIAARLVMTPVFLQFEYNRPDFPPDLYGFTREDRLNYAPYALNYMLNGDGITYLGDLRFPDGGALFHPDELRHMEDVKVVTTAAFSAAVAAGLVMLTVGVYLFRQPETRPFLRKAFFNGSILTLSLIAAIVVAALLNWDAFFTGFHTLFFASGTWRFAYSDTLIRLFPEQFWFDAALTIGGIVIGGSLLTLAAAGRWRSNNDI